MIIKTNHEEIFNLSEKELNKIDPEIYSFLIFWKSKKSYITVQTSGSTGKPKNIKIRRNAIINSAKATLDYFNIKENSRFHICLPVKYIGGKMMLVRAILNKAEIILTKPEKNVAKDLNDPIDFSAMTSIQVENSLKEKGFKNIKKLIIGGGPVNDTLIQKIQQLPTKCYQTFGMTETVSHIAIRELNKLNKDNPYKCLNHVEISTNIDGNLIIKSPYLCIESLTTNDIVQITGNKEFKYIGRSDNLINTGGIKVLPEEIERQLNESLQSVVFFVDKIPDNRSGEKIIVITNKKENTSTIKKACKRITPKHIRPQLIFFIEEFIFTENNKLKRKKIRNNAIKTNDCISI